MKRIYEIEPGITEELPTIDETPQLHSIIIFDGNNYTVNSVVYDTIEAVTKVYLLKQAKRVESY